MNQSNLMPAVEFRQVGFAYSRDASATGQQSPVLSRVDLRFARGEFALICGPTGAGKSTLLRLINGLAPHFTGGIASGEILLEGQNVLGRKPHELAALIGYVNQRPASGFVAETVAEELAFGMEQLGYAAADMRRRIDEVATLLQIDELLDRPVVELSGGQQQRVAIGAALAAGQRILLVDEPTSALDDESAAATIALLRGLTKTSSITVLVVEHRIDRLLGAVDSITVVRGDGSCVQGAAGEFADGFLRDALLPRTTRTAHVSPESGDFEDAALEVSELTVRHEGSSFDAVAKVSFSVSAGEILAIVGPNGAGKSTLLWSLLSAGVSAPEPHQNRWSLRRGRRAQKTLPGVGIVTDGRIVCAQPPALVPQDAVELLYLDSISAEFDESDSVGGEADRTARIFERLCGRIDGATHPRDLSAGQQLALAIAIQLARGSRVILLDEPTRGLDYSARREVAALLGELAELGNAVVLATHDSGLVATCADRTLHLEHGRLR